MRQHKLATGGFAESQAPYNGPGQAKEAVVRVVLRQMEDEVKGAYSFLHRIEDKLKLWLEMLES